MQEGEKGWAVFLWPFIETFLNKKVDRKTELQNKKIALLKQIEEIDKELNDM